MKLGISQPAISMHLSRLERAIGTSLIKKVGNKIIIKEEISRLIRQMLELERRLKTVSYERNASKLKVGVCTYSTPLLVERTERLGSLKNNLSWKITESRKLQDLYEQGELDAIFRALHPSEIAPDLVTEFSLKWIGDRQFQDDTSYEGQGLPVVLASPSSPLGAASREWLRQHEVSYDIVGEVDDIMSAIRLVSSGIASSPLPAYVRDSLKNCTQVLPGQLKIRYGLFINEQRFSLRTALDVFELLKEDMPKPAPSVPVAEVQFDTGRR